MADFKAKILGILGKPNHECIITSGASESNNLLFKGLQHMYSLNCSNFEHKNIIECVEELGGNVIPLNNISSLNYPNNSLISI